MIASFRIGTLTSREFRASRALRIGARVEIHRDRFNYASRRPVSSRLAR